MSSKQSDYMLEFGGQAISYRRSILVTNPNKNKLKKLLNHLQRKELTFNKIQLRYDNLIKKQ